MEVKEDKLDLRQSCISYLMEFDQYQSHTQRASKRAHS